jgi:hypothetical protein
MMNWKGFGRSGFDPIEVLFRQFLGETEENDSQDSQCSDRDSNPAPPDYESTVLPVYQPVR